MRQKMLKKANKYADNGQSQEDNVVNLAQRAGNTIELTSEQNQQNEEDITIASASFGSVILIGGALLLLATSAIYYGKKQGHKS